MDKEEKMFLKLNLNIMLDIILLTPKEFLHEKKCIRDQKKPFKTRRINTMNTMNTVG